MLFREDEVEKERRKRRRKEKKFNSYDKIYISELDKGESKSRFCLTVALLFFVALHCVALEWE